jgi:hypothetical protein
MAFVAIIAAALTAAQVIQIALTIASILYQRSRQKKLAAKARDEAEKQKGFQLIAEGESQPIAVFYGRNKAGGTRVYHRVSGDYTYAAPAATGLMFLSQGDARHLSTMLTSIVIKQIKHTTVEGTGEDAAYIYYDSGELTTTATVTTSNVSFTAPTGQAWTAGVILEIHHAPLFKDDKGELVTTVSAHPYTVVSYNSGTGALVLSHDAKVTQTLTPSLNTSVTGTKNEFLIVQQVIGYAGISDIYSVEINQKDFRDASFGASARIHAYPTGNIVDPLATANDETGDRADAVFSNAAYATMVFRLNRDEPQYQGVPAVQFYLEGMKVKTITGSAGSRSLSAGKTYSNNPALCLLDYLTNDKYGKGLTAAEIDLDSFYNAYLICEKVVMSDVPDAGRLWDEKGRTVQRDIKLYECNLAIDTSKPIRDNVEIMLETMGAAELIWSGGKYKLSLKYPTEYAVGTYNENDIVQYPAGYTSSVDLYRSTINGNVSTPGASGTWVKDVVAAYLDDDSIDRSEPVSISYPTAQSRLNYCTIRYLDESKDFAENTASWPPKDGAVYPVYLAEDSNLALETESFQSGDVTQYHALATAEELVRSSRASVVYSFAVLPEYAHLEPGDIIKITSTVLDIPGELLKVEDVKVQASGKANVQAIKYDARHLAWNAKDDEVVQNRNLYSHELSQASTLIFTDTSPTHNFSSGILSWNAPNDKRVTQYMIKATTDTPTEVNTETEWVDLGISTTTKFDIPALLVGLYTLTVVAMTGEGKIAPEYSPKTGSRWPVIDARASGLMNIVTAGLTINPVIIPFDSDGVGDYTNAFGLMEITDNGINLTESDDVTYSVVTQTGCTVSIDTVMPDKGKYTVTNIAGQHGTAILRAAYNGNNYDRTLYVSAFNEVYIPDTGSSVPSPTGASVSVGLNIVFIEHDAPTFTEGHGYKETRVYAAEYVSTLPVFADAELIYSFNTAVSSFPSELGRNLRVWLTWVSEDGTESAPIGGTNGFAATTGVIGNTHLGPLIIEAGNLAAAAVTPGKFASGIEPVTIIAGTTVPAVKSTEVIAIDGKLLRWSGSAYTAAVPAVEITGQLTNDQLAAIAAAKVTGQLTNAQIADIAAAKLTGQITTTQISDDAISTPKLAAGSVSTAKLVAGSITTEKIATDSISADKIKANAILVGHIAAGQIIVDHMAANSIAAAAIQANAVTADKISANAVTADKILANAVTAAKIQAGSVTADKIEANAVTATKIAANAIAVGTAAIQNGAIVNAMIGDAAITNAKIGDAQITSAKIGTAEVSTLHIAGNSVTLPYFASGNPNTTFNFGDWADYPVASVVVPLGVSATVMVSLVWGTGVSASIDTDTAAICVLNGTEVYSKFSTANRLSTSSHIGQTKMVLSSGTHTFYMRIRNLGTDGVSSTSFILKDIAMTILGVMR